MKIPLVDLKAQFINIKDEIYQAVHKVMEETAFIGGPAVSDFEQQFAQYCEVDYAVGCSSGTDALYIALWALGIAPGDEVILPAHTFIATSEAVRLLGAVPVFVDIEEHSFNLDPSAVVAKIGPRTRALIAVHIYGRPAPMEQLAAIAQQHGLALVGDGAQVHGARLGNRSVAQFGDATAFSFYPGKNLGAYGDAGAVVTNNPLLAAKMKKLIDHGRSSKYLHESLGTNARLDGLQAAILSVKLKYLDGWCRARRAHAASYSTALAGVEQVQTPEVPVGDRQHAMHLYVLRVPKADRTPLFNYLKDHGIDAGIHYPVPLHLQPCNADLGIGKNSMPVTERIVDEIISLPMYPELSEAQIAYVVEKIKAYFHCGSV
ncbi:MAG: DegT/DnrJ/EryC1/StrS family aminotransferase [Magnetococcales bacterium]|nr:DegT/DnrJ/EryC1/StrS family aminotransferase [Magnetococcales bacterium]NGZ28092.1 DegT/DnrJ/EryC1/StrS family aminotransferase [Magnetococcales bacterium]